MQNLKEKGKGKKFRYRDSIDMIYAILAGLSKHEHDAYQCRNMAYITNNKTRDILEYMERHALAVYNKKNNLWKITDRGIEMLKYLREMREIFSGSEMFMFEDPLYDPRNKRMLFD